MIPANRTSTAWRLPTPGAGFSALHQAEAPLPHPRAHEYLVRIHAVSLNYRDVAIAQLPNTGMKTKNDLVPASDMGGEIVEAGEDAVKFKIGERVTSMFDMSNLYGVSEGQVLGGPVDGVLQYYRIFPETALLRAPAHLSYAEIACLPCAGLTAWNALYGGGNPLLPGQTAVFLGTGGVSIWGLQIAKAAGARTIITSSSDAKLEVAKQLGATHVINYKNTPAWDKEVKILTGGEGAHRIIDTVGLSDIERAFGAVADGGVITNIGFLGGFPDTLPINTPMLALRSGGSMRGIHVGSKKQFEDLLRLVDVHKLHPRIDKVFQFEKAPQALEYLASAKHVGKVIVQIVPEEK